LKGLLRNLRRFSSSNRDQSIGSSSNGSENVLAVLPFSLLFAKPSRVVEESDEFWVFRKLKRLRLSCEDGKRKHSMKLAVPEFRRNFIDPLSDDASLSASVEDLVKSDLFNSAS
jgi:hypothetical protein